MFVIPKGAVDELREILKKEYSVNLTDVEAEDAARNLFQFFEGLISIERNNRKSSKQ